MGLLRWLHLSDIHYNFSNLDTDIVRDELIKSLKTISEKVDVVFITGDLFYRGNCEEKEPLKRYIKEIEETLNIRLENFFIVPGNHDTDREIKKELVERLNDPDSGCTFQFLSEDERKVIKDSFTNYYSACFYIFNKDYSNNDYHFYEERDEYNILHLNTALTSCNSETDNGRLEISRKDLYQVIRMLNKDKFTIAIGHHDFRLLNDADKQFVKNVFRNNNIILYLNGHYHGAGLDNDMLNRIYSITCSSIIKEKNDVVGYCIGSLDFNTKVCDIDFYKWDMDRYIWLKFDSKKDIFSKDISLKNSYELTSQINSAAKYRLPNRKNRFHYSQQSADFLGRENEILYLKEFCGYDGDMYPILTEEEYVYKFVYGESGCGKSRLCFEFALFLQNYGWTVCFPPDYSIKTLSECSEQLPNNTLFVLDYSEFDMETIAPWIQRLYRRSDITAKIRFLLIQRQNALVEMQIQRYTNGKELMNSLHSKDSLYVSPLNDEALYCIIASYAFKAKQKILIEQDTNRIYKKLLEMDKTLVRPLFAQILTDAYCDNPENMNRWSREDALDYICDKEEKEICRAIEEKFKSRKTIDYQDVQEYGLNILCAATMVGGMDMNSEFTVLMPKEAAYFQHNEMVLNDFLSLPQLFSPIDDKTYCPALEPDIIGEYFVIKYWRYAERSIKKLWSKPYFMSKFVKRLFQNHESLLSAEQKALLCNVSIPDSVTHIEKGTFQGCSSITSVTLPDSVVYIGEAAFQWCSGLTSITLPQNLKAIGGFAFQGCTSLTGINLPDSVESIGASSFALCTSLKEIILPDSVESIGFLAFTGCCNLTKITLPKNLKTTENSAFQGCGRLTSITLSDSIKSIKKLDFKNCRSLTDVYIQGTLTPLIHDVFYELGVTFHENKNAG